jgi:carbamate kinase
MIERCLRNVLMQHGIQRKVLTLMTMVEVKADDEAFQNPTKRIGKTIEAEESKHLNSEKGWIFKEEKKHPGGFRRVVASPSPMHIMNRDVIEENARNGTIVIAVGGGGIPVYFDDDGKLRPLEAVIDKDLASALLAAQINADEFYILTDVSFVYDNFGESNQRVLEFLNYDDALKYLESGSFGEGSMAPKIKAALHFIGNGGEKSVITESKKLEDKSFGTKLTMEYDERDLHKYS